MNREHNFYGALKSRYEIYFQMASIFKEITREEPAVADQWVHRILSGPVSKTAGKDRIISL